MKREDELLLWQNFIKKNSTPYVKTLRQIETPKGVFIVEKTRMSREQYFYLQGYQDAKRG